MHFAVAGCKMQKNRSPGTPAERMAVSMKFSREISSPLGPLVLMAEDGLLVGLYLPGQAVPDAILEDHPLLDRTSRWLERYFRGQTPDPKELPLGAEGTAFQKLIWKLLLEIPYGQTVTYGHLAQKAATILGKPHMSAQAVGQALRRNPIPIIVPCHRVVGSDGSLTGYAGALDGGLTIKRALLELESPEL